MPAERCYVYVQLNGTDHVYQRECEVSPGVAKPYFVPAAERSQAATMPEEVARILVERLRKLGGTPWIIDAKTGRRIDTPYSDAETTYGDDRRPCAATLDDVNRFLVTPICRPSGRCWFVKAVLPGPTNPQVFYGNTPREALQRAQDLSLLQYCERVVMPAPQPVVQPIQQAPIVRRRPGELR